MEENLQGIFWSTQLPKGLQTNWLICPVHFLVKHLYMQELDLQLSSKVFVLNIWFWVAVEHFSLDANFVSMLCNCDISSDKVKSDRI